MSVDRSDHIIYGWKLPFKLTKNGLDIDYFEDVKYLELIEGRPGIEYSIIRDGMCCEYTVFGQRIKDADDSWDFVELDISKLDSEVLKSKYRELFDGEPEEPKLFIFSHYS